MPNKRVYTKIAIRSRNELAKRLATKKIPFSETLAIIKDVSINKDKYWHDNLAESKVEEDKYVRSAYKTPLGYLLKTFDTKVLAKCDYMLPSFIFGGVSGQNHVRAAKNLVVGKGRVYFKVDLKRFFEQVSIDNVYTFFIKSGCSKKMAHLMSELCCVPMGSKDNPSSKIVLARGFSTSPRLAVWCNILAFLTLDQKLSRMLKHTNYKLSVYVDDIGVTSKSKDLALMNKAFETAKTILNKYGLKTNDSENKSKPPVKLSGKQEYLGLRLGSKKITIGLKTQKKLAGIKAATKKDPKKRKTLKEKLHGLRVYDNYVKKISQKELKKT
jgi:hypothetical protein